MSAKDTTDRNPQLGERRRELFRAILELRTVEECERFFDDLCTPAELAAMADRWTVARWVARGVAYRVIQEETAVSTTTVTRVARALRHGDGGYRLVLDRRQGRRQERRARRAR